MGEPCECEQEVANGVVMAGCMNRMAQLAEPTEIVDVDLEKAALDGRDLAERVHIVDKGGKERKSPLRLPKIEFYCKESDQRSRNTNKDVPITHGVLLKGEWTWYASGEASDPKGDTDVSNAAVEHAYRPSESRETEDAMEIGSEGCKGGMSKCTSVDEADGDPGQAAERGDAPNELTELLTTTVEPYVEDGDTSVHVCLGGTSTRTGDTNGPGSQVDGSRGQTDESKGLVDGSRGWMDTLNMSNSAEIACISHNDNLDTYLGAAGMKRPVHETDGIRNHVDAPIGRRDTPSVETETETAENERGNIRMGQIGSRTRDSPYTAEIEMFKHSR